MTSNTNLTDFQSRRLNIRFKDTDGNRGFVHTISATGVTDRVVCAIMENFQQADGSSGRPGPSGRPVLTSSPVIAVDNAATGGRSTQLQSARAHHLVFLPSPRLPTSRAMPAKITMSNQQRYSCIMCGRCCRRFHVLLRPAEIDRLKALDWGDEPDVPTDFVVTIHGFPYFRRQPDGGCVFLGQDGACRMHRRFGFDQKALTCRGYPFNIVSTFPGEVSVLARMDCPAVLQNHGTPIREQRRDIENSSKNFVLATAFPGATQWPAAADRGDDHQRGPPAAARRLPHHH